MSLEGQGPNEDSVCVPAPRELDLASADAFGQTLSRVDDGADLRVDFADVAFMDSSGLRVLVLTAERHAKAGSRFQVINASAQMRRLFEITALTHLLDDDA